MKYLYISAEFDRKLCDIFEVNYFESETTRIPLEKVPSITPCNLGIDIGVLGKDPWNKGKKTGPLTESHKKALSIAAKGYKRTVEHQEKLTASYMKDIDAHSKRISERLKGKKFTEEHKINIAKGASKPYTLIDRNGIKHEILGLKQFCEKNDLSVACMRNLVSGRRKQHKGWRIK